MAAQSINDFLPPEMRGFAERSVEQAKQAFDELMAATQRTVSAFEGQTSAAQTSAREIQRKVVAYSERNVATSLEFAQKLLGAKDAEAMMSLHAEYVQGQMQALAEQGRDIAQHTSAALAASAAPRTDGPRD